MLEDTQPPNQPPKLVTLQGGEWHPVEWGDGYLLQQYSWGKRVLCSTAGNRIAFLKRLLGRYPGPFTSIYILEDNHGAPGVRRGRYQRYGLMRPQVDFFLDKFSDFLEGGGRHHLMFYCESTKGRVVYDQHDYFYLYGGAEQLAAELRAEGMREQSYELGEHGHRFGDSASALHELIGFWPWEYRPLELSDVTRERTNPIRYLWLRLKGFWYRRSTRYPE